jgi:hypothetical protein
MRMLIRYQSGFRAEAVLLAANGDRMRVAIGSQRDTVELHKVDAGWRTQKGAAIEIEALIPIPGTEFSSFCAAVYTGAPRAACKIGHVECNLCSSSPVVQPAFHDNLGQILST